MFICNCPLCLHCTYSEAIFKLEDKNAVRLNHELVRIQLTVGSKEHINSLHFSNIKYALMPKILKDKCDRIDFILVQSLQSIPADIHQACVDHSHSMVRVAMSSQDEKTFFFQRMNAQTSQQHIQLSMTAIARGRTGFALFFVPEVRGKWISLFPSFTLH